MPYRIYVLKPEKNCKEYPPKFVPFYMTDPRFQKIERLSQTPFMQDASKALVFEKKNYAEEMVEKMQHFLFREIVGVEEFNQEKQNNG